MTYYTTTILSVNFAILAVVKMTKRPRNAEGIYFFNLKPGVIFQENIKKPALVQELVSMI